MYSFNQNVCIEVYGILNTGFTLILRVEMYICGLYQPLIYVISILLLSFTLENVKYSIDTGNYAENVLRMHMSSI